MGDGDEGCFVEWSGVEGVVDVVGVEELMGLGYEMEFVRSLECC